MTTHPDAEEHFHGFPIEDPATGSLLKALMGKTDTPNPQGGNDMDGRPAHIHETLDIVTREELHAALIDAFNDNYGGNHDEVLAELVRRRDYDKATSEDPLDIEIDAIWGALESALDAMRQLTRKRNHLRVSRREWTITAHPSHSGMKEPCALCGNWDRPDDIQFLINGNSDDNVCVQCALKVMPELGAWTPENELGEVTIIWSDDALAKIMTPEDFKAMQENREGQGVSVTN